MKIKSYTKIWTIEKMLYAIGDINLPFAMTFSQIAWLVSTFMLMVAFGKMPPLSLVENAGVKYALLPICTTWFMSKKTFDGKRPYRYLLTMAAYLLRPKATYAGKRVKLGKVTASGQLTAVRRYKINAVPNKIYRK